MRALLKTGFFLLLIAFGLIGASYTLLRAQGSGGPASPGSRLVASERRPVAAGIDSVDLSGPLNLTLRQGPPGLEVRGEQRLLANIDTASDGGVLHIGPRGILLRHRQPIEVILTLPALRSLSVNGSGSHTVSGFAGERIELALGGSGGMRFNGRYRDITASLQGSGDLDVTGGSSERVAASMMGSGRLTLVGSSRELQAHVNGSGDFDARHLQADAVHLTHVGSGDSALYARRDADVRLTGSGDVVIHGNPERHEVSRNGSGSVVFRD